MFNGLVTVKSINKRIITICLLISVVVIVLLFYIKDNFLFPKEACIEAVNQYIYKNDSPFLSDEYFTNVSLLFIKIHNEYGQWELYGNTKKIVAKAVINKMMDDLDRNPNALQNNRNFECFFEVFDDNIRKLDTLTERMHYFRNTLNAYSGAPSKLTEMIDLACKDEWQLFSAKYHRYNYGKIIGALNVKFISNDGRFEAVYNTGTGEIVTDPANMGTYNYAPGSINPIDYFLHNKYDKKPWKKWGNVKEFQFKDIIGLKSGHGSDESIKNEKEIAGLIKKRKAELEKVLF